MSPLCSVVVKILKEPTPLVNLTRVLSSIPHIDSKYTTSKLESADCTDTLITSPTLTIFCCVVHVIVEKKSFQDFLAVSTVLGELVST